MTIEEIFSKICAHMQKGLKLHSEMTSMFGFLNLCGYQKLQEYRYLEESNEYCKLVNFYISNYNKLIFIKEEEYESIIPLNWYKYTRQDVDTTTKRTAIRDLIKKWVVWESETKQLLENIYKECYGLSEINCALKISELIKDVSEELVSAQEFLINLESINYDIVEIIDQQDSLYQKYCKKIKHIHKEGD